MSLVSVQQRLAEIKAMMAKAVYSENDSEELLEIRTSDCPLWSDYIGLSLKQGQVVLLNNIKYLVMQAVAVVIESQSPSNTGMLAIYKPYRDSGTYEWLYGEYVEVGWIRTVTTDTTISSYKAIQDTGANIHSPELVPSVWELVETEEIE